MKDNFGRTAAHFAYGLDALKDLLAHGADPNSRNSQGLSVLTYKAASGASPSVELLLRREDVIMPSPRLQKQFQDVLECAYQLQVKVRLEQLGEAASWTQLVRLLDKVARDIRYHSRNSAHQMAWLLETLLFVAQKCGEKKAAAEYTDASVYIWDIFSCARLDEKYMLGVLFLLQSGLPLSWPPPGQPSTRKLGNVLMKSIEWNSFHLIPLILGCAD